MTPFLVCCDALFGLQDENGVVSYFVETIYSVCENIYFMGGNCIYIVDSWCNFGKSAYF